jgi:hypothetical protein
LGIGGRANARKNHSDHKRLKPVRHKIVEMRRSA